MAVPRGACFGRGSQPSGTFLSLTGLPSRLEPPSPPRLSWERQWGLLMEAEGGSWERPDPRERASMLSWLWERPLRAGRSSGA